MKTLEYIEALKARTGLSDYALAPLLGLSRSAISTYRNKNVAFDEDTAVRAADLLDLNPAEVLANIRAERAKDARVRAVWEALAEHLHSAAAGIVLAIMAGTGIAFFPSPAMASVQSNNATGYTLCEVARRRRS